MKEYYTIGEISRLFGVTSDTLRFYDRIDLLKPWKTGDNGYRYYSKAQFELISSILLLRNIGTPIKRLQEALRHEDSTLVSKELSSYSADIDKRIAELTLQKKQLSFLEDNIEKTCSPENLDTVELLDLKPMYALIKKYDSRTDELDIGDIESINKGSESDWIAYANLVSTISAEDLQKGDFHTYKTYGYISDSPCLRAPKRLYTVFEGGKYVCANVKVESVEHFEVDRVYGKMLEFIRANDLKISGDAIERSILNLYRNNPDEVTIYFRLYIPVM